MTAGSGHAATRLRVRGAVAVACLLVIVLLTACAPGDATLDALRSDPMASATFDGAELVSEREREASGLAKPSPAVIRRTFEITADPEVVLAGAVESAHAWGWTELQGTASFTAERTIDGVGAVLLIFVEDTDDDVLLQVSIEST